MTFKPSIQLKIAIFALMPSLLIWLLLNVTKQRPIQDLRELNNLELTTSSNTEILKRKKILSEFFKKYKSPLAPHADKFIEISVKYNIDYRLLPAISCTESSCGKFLIPSSHNPFGWGIYGNKVTSFVSYDEAIEKVAAGISKNYVARGYDTPERMGPIYNPVSHKAWSGHTRFFMNKIDEIAFDL